MAQRAFLSRHLPHSLAHRVAQLAVEFSPTHYTLVVLPGTEESSLHQLGTASHTSNYLDGLQTTGFCVQVDEIVNVLLYGADRQSIVCVHLLCGQVVRPISWTYTSAQFPYA